MNADELESVTRAVVATLAPTLEKMHRDINEVLSNLYARLSQLEAGD